MEPYGEGVIAASKRLDPIRAYDLVYQNTIYCRKGGEGKLMLTADGGFDLNESDPNFSADVYVYDQFNRVKQHFPIPNDRVQVRFDDDTTWITFDISKEIQESILISSGFSAQLGAARAAGWYRVAGHDDLTDMERKIIASALTHCI